MNHLIVFFFYIVNVIYETFNGYIRTLNLFSNRQCINRDIATKAAISEQFAHVCSGAKLAHEDRQLVILTSINVVIYMLLCRTGDGLVKLYADPELQRYFSHASSKNLFSDKAIFQPGAVRKVSQCL